ncbi:MAG: 50S ribosomal protein L21, partial [Flavobacteriales bacterium]
TVGAPAIDGAQVGAKVIKHLKGDKVIVFKKKRRKGYRKKNGHRQALSEIIIESIIASGAKKATKAENEGAKKVAKVKNEVAKKATPAKAKKAATAKEAPKAVAKPAAKKEKATQDLSKLTVAELREMAKAKDVSGYSSMKKADLIAALS